MDSIIRGTVTYFFVWLIFRIAGKRSLAETTTFDFVLLLIISETVQSALNQNDNSLTNSFLIIITLVGLDILLSVVGYRVPRFNHLMNSRPVLIVENGKPVKERMAAARIEVDDILASAREHHGLERMDQIKFAVLETHGGISIIPEAKS
ncbi:MAG TPA: YetF domain-containing protein [Oligoflexus sp.]|uniref:DUF421 domain-containing protein n=1 Tax=Oligoflexus sp. TaxID=1971216 RepID=UPI002D7E779E|nr:YetF domain-containing protein [Oligoflexus sp.]HET9241585.1 YetF domain-containing protein [Oligoflexus sp.]